MNQLRNRNKLNKNNKVVIICFALIFITIGFAAISTTLGITANTKVAKMSFDVHFENLTETAGSVEATSKATINENNPTEINFNIGLTIPGEYYEFEVDVVNSGTIDAKLSSIEVNGLTDSQKKYLKATYFYADDTKIEINDSLKAGAKTRIKVKVEYMLDVTAEDLPNVNTTAEMTFLLDYVQDMGDGVQKNQPYFYAFASKYAALDSISSQYVASLNGMDFNSESSDTNGRGLYVRSGTENDENPIYYYRGDVLDNNVLFAGKCWKILHTTETGGTKLIYNGLPNEKAPICGNSGENKIIANVSFYNDNSSLDNSSLAYAGYMYGDILYNVLEERRENLKSGIVYANDVEWDGTNYILKGDKYISTDDFGTDTNNITNAHRYTCGFSEVGLNSCENVKFIYDYSWTTRYIVLKNGKKIENVLDDILPESNDRNKYDSNIKSTIDEWFSSEMLDYNEYLEDTIFCNDRSIYSVENFDKDATDYSQIKFFGRKIYEEPYQLNLTCSNKYDRFTLKENNANSNISLNGNQMLDYPVGLISLDEAVLAGISNLSFLSEKQSFWLMTPCYYINGTLYINYLERGWFGTDDGRNYNGIRPSVSLRSDIKPVSGDGTVQSPFVIE